MRSSTRLTLLAFRGFAVTALLFATACHCISSGTPRANVQGDVGTDIRSINILVGARQLDEDDWAPVDEPGVIGLEYAHEPGGYPVGFEIGFSYAGAEEDEFVAGPGNVEFTNTAVEFYAGARKTFFPDAGVRPYVGLGLTVMAVELEGESGGLSADDDDTTFGGYAHGGLEVRITNYFHLGLDLRAVFGTDVELFDASADADYQQLALVAGFSI